MARRRKLASPERTYLCALKAWELYAPDSEKPAKIHEIRATIREPGARGGLTPSQVTDVERRLVAEGRIKIIKGHWTKVKLTSKGRRTGCRTAKVSTWTNKGRFASGLSGKRGKAKCKNITVKGKKRKMCWGPDGKLVSNTAQRVRKRK